MQVLHKIDQLIENLTTLKPSLSSDNKLNTEKFNNIIKSALEISSSNNETSKHDQILLTQKKQGKIPSWVDPNYSYDPSNPRKPNMLEFRTAISNERMKGNHSGYDETNPDLSTQAAELLYGVVGSNKDTRNWSEIMGSEKVLDAARLETGIMYGPKVQIKSIFDDNGTLTEQVAVLTDRNENTLRAIPTDLKMAEETLRNFGATRTSLPVNLGDNVIPEKFGDNLLNFLVNFDKASEEVPSVVLQATTDAISKRLTTKIPIEEYEKL
jgi:hypothetical protein